MAEFAGVRIRSRPVNQGDEFAGIRLRPRQEMAQSNAELVGKSLASGVISNADIPQTIAEASLNPEYSAFGQARKLYHHFTRQPHQEFSGPDYISSLPSASSKIKGALKEYGGMDVEPRLPEENSVYYHMQLNLLVP